MSEKMETSVADIAKVEISAMGVTTLEGAKAAAQADYEQRIRCVLLPAPTRDDVLERIVQVFETISAGLKGQYASRLDMAKLADIEANRIRSLKGGKS